MAIKQKNIKHKAEELDAVAALATGKTVDAPLTDAQKSAMRTNIGAASKNEVDGLNNRTTDLELLTSSLNNAFILSNGYLQFSPDIEKGNLSKYGEPTSSSVFFRTISPYNFGSASKIKVTPLVEGVRVQVVAQNTNQYVKNTKLPIFDIQTTSFEFEPIEGLLYGFAFGIVGVSGETIDTAKTWIKIEILVNTPTYSDVEKLKKFQHTNGKNLFPSFEKCVNGYIDANGNLIAGSYKTSDFICVEGLSNLCFSWTNSNGQRYTRNCIVATYGSGKNFLSQKLNVPTYTIEDGVKYVRISVVYVTTHDEAVMVEEGTIPSEYEKNYQDTSVAGSSYKKLNNSEANDGKLNIVCWGDSLTRGVKVNYASEGSGEKYAQTPYPSALAQMLPNAKIMNFGVPGETATAIACRQGSSPIILQPCTIPSTGSVAIPIKDRYGNDFITLGHNGWGIDLNLYNFTIGNINGAIGYANNSYTFKRFFDGESVTIDRPQVIKTYGRHYREYLHIIWAGTNDSPTEKNGDAVLRTIQQMVEYSSTDKYIVVGLTHDGDAEYKVKFNKMLADTFGSHFVNVLDYLKEYGLEDNNLTATSQDTTDIANNIVPTSLRGDSIHLNDYGYYSVAKAIYQRGKDLDYWE